MKVLIIDDDADLLEMTARRMKKKGFEVHSAIDLTIARQIIKQISDLNVIICDLFLLNGENGMDFFEMEVKDTYKGKFILATGDDSADNRIEKNKSSYPNFTCFQKPYSIDDVLNYIG